MHRGVQARAVENSVHLGGGTFTLLNSGERHLPQSHAQQEPEPQILKRQAQSYGKQHVMQCSNDAHISGFASGDQPSCMRNVIALIRDFEVHHALPGHSRLCLA
jgi:hypothetical protein